VSGPQRQKLTPVSVPRRGATVSRRSLGVVRNRQPTVSPAAGHEPTNKV
jgi:hypothetical protein